VTGDERPLRLPGAYAFVGSGCLLVLELLAGRILAPVIGVSLYTWTSIIGVVLAGISLGNWLGGRVADRWPGRGPLSSVYLLAALASAMILVFARDLGAVDAPGSWPAMLQVVWLAALLFLVPSTLLGMATPLLVKLTLRSLGATGRVVGRIQALATLGSIVGTFATGFFLISWFGTRAIVAGVAGTLGILGVLAVPRWSCRRAANAACVLLLVGVAGLVADRPCLRESNYYCISVLRGDAPTVRVLRLDLLVHGFVDLADPARPIYSYELLYDELLRATYPPGTRVETFAIGGGSYSFPRYLEAHYAGRILVAEIDPAVTAVARSHLGLRPGSRIEIAHDDARRVLAGLDPEARFRVIAGDAFNDAAVPYHLTTREFNELVARHLADDGLYMVNVVDAVRFDFLRSYVATLRLTFPHVGLLAMPGRWPPSGIRDSFVAVGSRRPLPPTPSLVAADELARFLASGRALTLTDDHVPVDQLLAPVFRQRLESR
jgi:predicted membrane-bound spermidine synthase